MSKQDNNENDTESVTAASFVPMTGTKKVIQGILIRSPLTKRNTLLLIGGYISLLFITGIVFGPYRAFGITLLTNTITVAGITRHEKGFVSADTITKKITYYGLAGSFGIIGLYYILAGL